MVRHATETAVSASISTPVWPVTLTVACTTKAGQGVLGLDVDRDLGDRQRMAERDQLVRALGRHDAGDARGAEHVAFHRVAGEHQIERLLAHDDPAFGDARCARSRSLPETSTMRASPRWSRWLRALGARQPASGVPRLWPCAISRCAGVRAREQRARRGGDVGLPHQALADQEGRDAGAGEAGEVGRRVDAAFADHDAVVGDARRQPLAERRGRLKVPGRGC